jgi:hypothetical protein
VEAALKTLLGLSDDQAMRRRRLVEHGVGGLPIVLTVGSVDWFGNGVPADTVFKPASGRDEEADYATLFAKADAKGTIHHLGEYPRPEFQGRGKNYKRFRAWKDQMSTGNRGFSDAELPTFAAVGINWPAYASMSDDAKNYAKSPYGDTHFVLDPDKIRDIVVYTATDHGHPRRDPFLAFADLLLGGIGATGIKDMKSVPHAMQIINSCTLAEATPIPTQAFEIQIFGKVDVSTDVTKVVVAPNASEGVKRNVKKFCKKNGIAHEFLAEPAMAIKSLKYLHGDLSKMPPQHLAAMADFATDLRAALI